MSVRRCIAAVALLAAATACGGSSGGSDAAASPSPTVDTVAVDTAAITLAWQTFFTAGGPVDSHIALLEDGEKFRPELTASAKDPSNAYLSAKVTDVVVNGTSATVTYDLNGRNFVLLGGSMGEAVKIGAKWLVSKQTYCQLVTLQDSSHPHPGCT